VRRLSTELGILNIKINVSFRFLNLDKFQAITLSREISGATYVQQSEKGNFIGAILLSENLDNLDDLNIFFVRQQVQLSDCDILIFVTAENAPCTIEIPARVNKFLKHIDCKLTFSFQLS
jgi:hypothetical protein